MLVPAWADTQDWAPSGEGGPPSQARSQQFEAQPLNFGLGHPDFLEPAQLGLAWIIHPDYDDLVGGSLHRAWNKERRQAEADGLVGAVAVDPADDGNWPNFAAIDLSWIIPTDLDLLKSEYLAVSISSCTDWIYSTRAHGDCHFRVPLRRSRSTPT